MADDYRDNLDDETGALGPLLDNLRRSVSMDIRCIGVGVVNVMTPSPPTVDVTLVSIPIGYTRTGQELPSAPTVLLRLPVVFPGSPAGWISTPVLPGHVGLTLHTDRSFTAYSTTGVIGDPVAAHTHALGDALFMPIAALGTAQPMSTPAAVDAVVIESNTIRFGPTAAQPLVLGTAFATLYNDLVTQFNNLLTAVQAHTHPVVGSATSAPNVLAPLPTAASPLTATQLSTKAFTE